MLPRMRVYSSRTHSSPPLCVEKKVSKALALMCITAAMRSSLSGSGMGEKPVPEREGRRGGGEEDVTGAKSGDDGGSCPGTCGDVDLALAPAPLCCGVPGRLAPAALSAPLLRVGLPVAPFRTTLPPRRHSKRLNSSVMRLSSPLSVASRPAGAAGGRWC